MGTKEIKASIVKEIEARRSQFNEISLKIHSNPELGFKEEKAAALLTGYLEENGFSVERGICQLPTAFRASYGTGKPKIAVLAEYDALPDLGHACGHNIIATSAIAAAIASRIAVDQFGGTILVLGTPAEELYGGKALMAEEGAFDNLDIAMIIHPGGMDTATTYSLACQSLEVEFFGKPAHAAASPETGINALEAMIQSFTAINSLRQHIRETARVHGIITDGGEAANVVPAHSAGSFLVRARENDYLEELKEKVLNCFIGAATATGARLEYEWDKVRYAPMLNNIELARLFTANMQTLGRHIILSGSDRAFGSTDMGNVSQIVPSIHANVAIAGGDAQLHTVSFAEAAASENGLKGIIDASGALAMTVADILADPGILTGIKDEFEQAK
ncbi:M20 family metallopeptidase [Chloroflexota bacterium]